MAAYCQCCGERDSSIGGILCRTCTKAFNGDKNNYGVIGDPIKGYEWAYIQRIQFELESKGKTQQEIDAKIAEAAKEINAERAKKQKTDATPKPETMSDWIKRKFLGK